MRVVDAIRLRRCQKSGQHLLSRDKDGGCVLCGMIWEGQERVAAQTAKYGMIKEVLFKAGYEHTDTFLGSTGTMEIFIGSGTIEVIAVYRSEVEDISAVEVWVPITQARTIDSTLAELSKAVHRETNK